MPCQWVEVVNAVAVVLLVVVTLAYTTFTFRSLRTLQRQNKLLQKSMLAQLRHSALMARASYQASRSGGWTDFLERIEEYEAFVREQANELDKE